MQHAIGEGLAKCEHGTEDSDGEVMKYARQQGVLRAAVRIFKEGELSLVDSPKEGNDEPPLMQFYIRRKSCKYHYR
jgi:hypothetical protein